LAQQSRRSSLVLASLGGALALGGGAALIRYARAQGIPSTDPLVYRGTLDESAGPVTDPAVAFTLRLLTPSGTAACSTTQTRPVAAGAFELTLPADCVQAVRANRDLSAELTVTRTGSAPTTHGPVRLTAVPYAVEAERAGSAVTADPGGALATQLAALQSQVAALQARVTAEDPDCPSGYTRVAGATPGVVCSRPVSIGGMTLVDEVVKVGARRSAFWVDRYEASVHLAATGVRLGESNTAGGTVGLTVDTSGLTPSGQRPRDAAGPAQALSHPGQPTVNITWFQANEACRASGKRLLERDEWFAAASGTVDGAACNVSTFGARAAAASNGCTSTAGAQDMIGNVWEWTNEWYASAGQVTSPAQTAIGARVTGIRVNDALTPWPADYNGDGTWNITSTVYNDAEGQIGIPSAARRGGTWDDGSRAGVFALYLNVGPSYRDPSIGFRCVVPG